MTDEAREARKLYKREWQRSHRDLVKAYQRKYWERKAAQKAAEKPQEAQEQQGMKV